MHNRPEEVPYEDCSREASCLKFGACQEQFFITQLISTKDWKTINDVLINQYTCQNPFIMRLLIKNIDHLNPETIEFLQKNNRLPPII